jgi:hypothetical protein
MKLSDFLNEAMERDEFHYKSVNPKYKLNGDYKNIIILDPNYKGDSILAFDLNVVSNKKLVKKIQKTDSKIMGLKKKKGILMSAKNKGFYPEEKDIKINRYKELVFKFPELKKSIRRYKFGGIK